MVWLSPGTATSHVGVPGRESLTPPPNQFPVNVYSARKQVMVKDLGPCYPCGSYEWSSGLLVQSCPSLTCLGNGEMNQLMQVSLSPPDPICAFQINETKFLERKMYVYVYIYLDLRWVYATQKSEAIS